MPGKTIWGSSFSINHEFNFKGKSTEIRGQSRTCQPVEPEGMQASLNAEQFAPSVLGAIPVGSGGSPLSAMEKSVLGSFCAAGRIQIHPTNTNFSLNYVLPMLKLMDGASANHGMLNEKDLKKRIMNFMTYFRENAAPSHSNWKEIIKEAMQNAVLQNVMKGNQLNVCAMTGDPVNADTGNFVYEKKDLLIKGRTPLCVKRSYNRMDSRSASMGKGWRHNYEISLLSEEDRYVLIWGDGREEVFLKDKDSSPVPLFGERQALKSDKNGYLYEETDGHIYWFDQDGKLLWRKDARGWGIFYSYDQKNRLHQVSNQKGSVLTYHYDHFNGLLCEITDHTGRRVKFSYEFGRLKEVLDAEGGRYQYFYDFENNVSRIYNPRGICVLNNDYDTKGRTISQKFADGGEISYHYQEEEQRTLVTEQNGNRVAYVHDELYRNVKTVHVDGEEQFRYNERNQLVLKTDKRGNKTKFAYDDKGNISQVLYPDGEKHNMTYDANGRLLVFSVNGMVKVKNIYDTQGNRLKTIDALNRGREMNYDHEGNIVEIIQPDGSRIFLDYDCRGNITRILEDSGRQAAYTYDDCNRVIRAVDGEGNHTLFAYDACNRLTTVTNAEGKCRRYTYTPNGKLEQFTDYNGAVWAQTYNCVNKVEKLTLPDGETIRLTYDQMQNIAKKIYPNGAEESYHYDASNRLERVILPNGGEIFYAYDLDGNCIAQTDAEKNKTEFIYDERNRLIKTISPTGAVTAYEYNQEGRLSCIKNAAKQSHTYDYDAMGQLIRETSVSGNSTSYEYNAMGKVSAVIDAGKRRTEYEYYPGGQLKKIIFPDGRSERFIYNKNGRLLRRQNHNGTTLEYSYDRLNRLVLVRSNLGQEKSYTYDAVGNVTSIKDALGHRTQYAYSKGGKLLSVTDAEENQTEYSYDAMGRLAAVCRHDKAHGISRTTQYERDLMGNILCAVNPLGLKEYYDYDKMGRLVRKTDRDGYETQYSYNGEGDLESILYGDGRRAEFSYHPLRKLQEIKDWLGSIRVEWDDAGRMKKIQNQRGEEICYTWGALGEKEACLYPDGRKVSYEYDELGRLSRLTEGSREVLYQYDQEGRLCKKQYPEGLTSTYDYNALGLLSRLSYQQQGEVLEQYTYEYDQMGNKTSIRKNRNFQTQSVKDNGFYQYQYDALNRLVGVRKDRRLLRRYAYDAFGNRILKEDEGSSIHYHYNAADQMVSLKGAGRTEQREYDGRGNLTAVARGQKVINRYHYGADNRLEEAVCADGRKAHYQYDGLGNRVGVEEYQKDDPENPVKTVEYLLEITRQYHNLLTKTEITAEKTSSQSFVWDNDILFAEDGGNVGFYLQDELGSTMRFLDPQNKEETIYGYDEFGQDLYDTQGQKQPFGYTGYQRDSIAGTYFAQAREYLADVGRFCGEDSIKGQAINPRTLNPYIYCVQNPLKWTDLQGKNPIVPSENDAMDWFWKKKRQNAEDTFEYIFSGEYFKDQIIPEPQTYSINIGELSSADYIGAMYLLNEGHLPGPEKGWNLGGAAGHGHAALLLIKEDGMSEFYSYAGAVEGGALVPEVGSNGYLSTVVDKGKITEIEVNDFFAQEGTYADSYANPGRIGSKIDSYSHGVYIPITNEEGKAMHSKAMGIRQNPGIYNLWSHNCNMVAQTILGAGGKSFAPAEFDYWGTRPDTVYNEIVEAINKGEYPGWLYGDLNSFHYADDRITNCLVAS